MSDFIAMFILGDKLGTVESLALQFLLFSHWPNLCSLLCFLDLVWVKSARAPAATMFECHSKYPTDQCIFLKLPPPCIVEGGSVPSSNCILEIKLSPVLSKIIFENLTNYCSIRSAFLPLLSATPFLSTPATGSLLFVTSCLVSPMLITSTVEILGKGWKGCMLIRK